MAKHKDEAQWRLLYNNLLEHKGTMAEFCSQQNINLKTFKNWCYKFRKLEKNHAICHKNNNKKSKFIRLQLPSNDTIKIKLPNGIMVEVSFNNLMFRNLEKNHPQSFVHNYQKFCLKF